jgi:hypothetical protein
VLLNRGSLLVSATAYRRPVAARVWRLWQSISNARSVCLEQYIPLKVSTPNTYYQIGLMHTLMMSVCFGRPFVLRPPRRISSRDFSGHGRQEFGQAEFHATTVREDRDHKLGSQSWNICNVSGQLLARSKVGWSTFRQTTYRNTAKWSKSEKPADSTGHGPG